MKEKIELVLFDIVDLINKQLKKKNRLEKSLDTPLIGENSTLDSLGVVNFITTTEVKIEEAFDLSITLTEDTEFMFSENGPLQSIGTLAIFIAEQLE